MSQGKASGGEKSGGSTSYYVVDVVRPNQGNVPYQAECGDIIEALGMNFNEGCAFKAIWRSAAARTLGKLKYGQDSYYDAQKVEFYGGRMRAQFEPPLADSPRSNEDRFNEIYDEMDNNPYLMKRMIEYLEPTILKSLRAYEK